MKTPHPVFQPEDDLSDVYLSDKDRACGWRVIGNRVDVADYHKGAFNRRIYDPLGRLVASPETGLATEQAIRALRGDLYSPLPSPQDIDAALDAIL